MNLNNGDMLHAVIHVGSHHSINPELLKHVTIVEILMLIIDICV